MDGLTSPHGSSNDFRVEYPEPRRPRRAKKRKTRKPGKKKNPWAKIERLSDELAREVAKKRFADAKRTFQGVEMDLGFEAAYMLQAIHVYPQFSDKELAELMGKPLKEVRAALKEFMSHNRAVYKNEKTKLYESRI